jgi:glycosyltransferase involved in cell wall biosynthesis
MYRPLSVVVITYNEAEHIEACLASVAALADDIVVLDSFSDDNTVQKAQQAGARVFQHHFDGYIEQKNRALSLAQHKLVLSLDADERVDNELYQAISDVKNGRSGDVFLMKRLNFFAGKPIRFGLWYPDKKIRLFNREKVYWGGLNPHDRILLIDKTAIVKLCGHIIHVTFNNVNEYRQRNRELSEIAAEAALKAGKSVRWYKRWLSPCWAFINGYFLRLGFLNGKKGLQIAWHSASYAYMKYQRLYELQRLQKKESNWNVNTAPSKAG